MRYLNDEKCAALSLALWYACHAASSQAYCRRYLPKLEPSMREAAKQLVASKPPFYPMASWTHLAQLHWHAVRCVSLGVA